MIYEICTRKCTRNARFHTDFGRFSCFFANSDVYYKKKYYGSVENQWGLYFPFLYPPNNTLIPLVIDRCNEIYILYFAFVDVY